jgi:hypothetical protein
MHNIIVLMNPSSAHSPSISLISISLYASRRSRILATIVGRLVSDHVPSPCLFTLSSLILCFCSLSLLILFTLARIKCTHFLFSYFSLLFLFFLVTLCQQKKKVLYVPVFLSIVSISLCTFPLPLHCCTTL